mgnify:CR=1 FL=1
MEPKEKKIPFLLDKSVFSVDIEPHKFGWNGEYFYDFRQDSPESPEDRHHLISLANELAYFRLKPNDLPRIEPYLNVKKISIIGLLLYFMHNWVRNSLITLIRNTYDNSYKRSFYSGMPSIQVYSTIEAGFETIRSMANERFIVFDQINKGFYVIDGITRRMALIDKIAELKSQVHNILEFGCGVGINMILLNTIAMFANVSGFEYSSLRFATAIKNIEHLNATIRNLFLANGLKTPLNDNSFDLTFAMDVLTQIHGQEQLMIDELIRVSRKFILICEGLDNIRIGKLRKAASLAKVLSGGPKPANIERLLLERRDIRIIWNFPYRYIVLDRPMPSRIFLLEKIT